MKENMGFLNQEKVESSENPNECQEIVDDFINYDPKTAGKRKRDTDEEVVDSDQCVNDNKMRRLCNVDVKEENQQVKVIDQELSDLSVEEMEKIERNLDAMFGMISEKLMEENKSMTKGCDEDDMVMMPLPLSSSMDFFNYNEFDFFNYNQDGWLNLPGLSNTTTDDDEFDFFNYNQDEWLNLLGLSNTTDDDEFDLSVEEIERNLEAKFGMISEKLDQLMEENKSMAKGCNEDDDMVMRNESPPLPLEPKFDYQSSSMDFFNYNSEFDYGINQEDWVNLPVLTDNYGADDGKVFGPFPDLIDLELNNYAGGFTDMMINCC